MSALDELATPRETSKLGGRGAYAASMNKTVRGAAAAPAGMSATSPVLIGRDRELRALLNVVMRPPALAVVQGEAGLGKTRLVSELLRQDDLREKRLLIGRCRPMRQPFVLEPVIDALHGARELHLQRPLSPVTGVLRPLLPELNHLLPPVPKEADDPLIHRHLLFRAVIDLLGSIGPTVCVLEDLHWADTYTAEFVRFAESHLPPTLSLVVTFRREDLADTSPLIALAARQTSGVGLERVSLAPLSRGEVRSLLAAMLRTNEISEEFVTFVHGRTEGIPFAVEEVLRLIVERQDLILHHGRWIRRAVSSLTVPESITDSVAERLGRLSPEARRIVEAAAVVGAPADAQLLASVAGFREQEVLEDLYEALCSALLVEDDSGRCSFRHTLASQAVYEGIPRAVRPVLHERVAEALEHVEPRPLAVLSHHYREAGRRSEWITCAEAAAALASALHDDGTAVDLLLDVVAKGALPPDELSRVAIKLARGAARGLTARPDVVAVVRRVLAEGQLPANVSGELRYLLGVLLVTADDGAGGHDEWQLAVSELRDCPDLAITVMTHLAYPWVSTGTGDDHLLWLQRAADAATRSADPIARMTVTASRAGTLLALGDPGAWEAVRALPHTTPPKASSSEATRLLVWTWLELGGTALLLGHFARAWDLLETATRIAERFEYLVSLGAAHVSRLGLRWATGAWDGLEAEADRLADAYADSPLWSIQAAAVSGFLAAARGDLDKAERIFRACFEGSQSSAPSMYALAAGQLARLRLTRSQPDAAWDIVKRGLDALEAKQIWAWSHWAATPAVETMIATDRLDDAVKLVGRIAEGLRGRDAPWSDASLSFCRGLVDAAAEHHADAARWFAGAEQRYGALPHPYESARAREHQALSLLAEGEPGSDAGLHDAVARFIALGATADERRVRLAMRRHNIPQPSSWRGGRIGYGNKLSPREEAVARLAARGRTNAEIARELFLSPKTVEHHIGSCMRKLKVRSRIELANRLTADETSASAPANSGR